MSLKCSSICTIEDHLSIQTRQIILSIHHFVCTSNLSFPLTHSHSIMSKVLTIFGATGNQGGSVIRAVLADPKLSQEFKIRAVTRDTTKASAKALAAKGVELVTACLYHTLTLVYDDEPRLTPEGHKADMSSPETAAPAVQDAHTVFLVTNFWESMSDETEIAQGKAVADACKTAGVKHLIFSSLINANKATQGRLQNVKHFDSKAKIEDYIRQIGLPATFVQPGIFMSGLLGWIRKGEDGEYTWAMPFDADTTKMPLFDAVADTGTCLVSSSVITHARSEGLTSCQANTSRSHSSISRIFSASTSPALGVTTRRNKSSLSGPRLWVNL